MVPEVSTHKVFKDVCSQFGTFLAEVASIASAIKRNEGGTSSLSPDLYNTSMVYTLAWNLCLLDHRFP